MATAYPEAGSAYAYARRALHPAVGFLAGWTMLLDYVLVPLLSIVYVAAALSRFVPSVPAPVWGTAFALSITALNLAGIQVTARANFAMTAVMFAVVGWFLAASATGGAALSLAPFYHRPEFRADAVMAGASIAALSFLGFDGISTLAEEAREPRDVARATLAVCLLAGALFVPQAYFAQLIWPDFRSFPQAETAFLDVSRRAGGDALFAAVSMVLLIAGVASAVTGQASASRLMLGMGRDGALPARWFAYVHPRFATPAGGLAVTGAISIAGAWLLTFQAVAELVNFGALFGFMCVNASVIRRYWRAGRWFRDLALPAAGFCVCLYLFLHLSAQARSAGAVWLLVGLAYWRWRAEHPKSNIQHPPLQHPPY